MNLFCHQPSRTEAVRGTNPARHRCIQPVVTGRSVAAVPLSIPAARVGDGGLASRWDCLQPPRALSIRCNRTVIRVAGGSVRDRLSTDSSPTHPTVSVVRPVPVTPSPCTSGARLPEGGGPPGRRLPTVCHRHQRQRGAPAGDKLTVNLGGHPGLQAPQRAGCQVGGDGVVVTTSLDLPDSRRRQDRDR